jgi:urease accessory protein UreE
LPFNPKIAKEQCKLPEMNPVQLQNTKSVKMRLYLETVGGVEGLIRLEDGLMTHSRFIAAANLFKTNPSSMEACVD